MSEVAQAPQENKTQNKQPENKQQAIPTWAGILIVIALVVAFILLFLKFQNMSLNNQTAGNPKAAAPSSPAVSSGNEANPAEGTTAPAEGTTAPAPSNEPPAVTPAPAAKSSINIDYEINKMDDSANSVSENDFNSANFSDAQIGL
jgi:cytoskeletal protein RodZ